MRVISLSTIPPRFGAIGPTLDSLTQQTGQVDEIRLYVPKRYRRFPDYQGELPEVPAGVTIIQPDYDLGPASKVLFAAQSFRGHDAQILFCDDDRLYPQGWAATLFDEQRNRPDDCVALIGKDLPAAERTKSPRAIRARSSVEYRVRRLRHRVAALFGSTAHPPEPIIVAEAGYVDILQGYGGAVIRPDFFDDRAFDVPDVLWAVDDYWLSGLLAISGVGIWLPSGLERPAATSADDMDALFDATIDGTGRLDANSKCIQYMQDHFDIWR